MEGDDEMTKPTLKKILSDLLDRAKATPGLGVSFNLKHGLTLHMKIDLDNTSLLHLGISRHETDPSEKEWDIVCRDCGLPKVSYNKTILLANIHQALTAIHSGG